MNQKSKKYWKNLIILGAIISVFLFVFILHGSKDNFRLSASLRGLFQGENKEREIIVVACPTFHYILDELKDFEWIKTVKSINTAESFFLLRNNFVDAAISGRPLKKNEPDFSSQVIGEGYDFIFKEEKMVKEKEMSSFVFFTDLEKEKILEDFEYILESNLIKVERVGEYLTEGIIITSLEDRMFGESVHILKENNMRVRLSRKPRIYYLPTFEEEKLELLKKLIKEFVF